MIYASRPNAGSPLPSALKRPTSPTFSDATTQASALNINGGPDTIITRAHLRTSVQTYEEVRLPNEPQIGTPRELNGLFFSF